MANWTDEREDEPRLPNDPDVLYECEPDDPMPVDWPEIAELALAFEGYDYWGTFEKCADVADGVASSYARDGSLPNLPAQIQTALFFEQRRYHHFGRSPSESEMPYIRALASAIRRAPREEDIESKGAGLTGDEREAR